MRSESFGRRQSTRHHIEISPDRLEAPTGSNPFKVPSVSDKLGYQFTYVRNPIKRQYRRYQRQRSPYQSQKSYQGEL